MLNQEEIGRISRFTGMKLHQQEKHYIQTIILKSLYSKYNLFFKGGTALMFVYGLNRFSEDLDFTLSSKTSLKSLAEEIKRDLELSGISSQIKKIKDDDISFSFRIGAEGPLFTREIERCFVRIEISRRENVILKPDNVFIDPIYSDLLPFSLTVMKKDEILAEKIRAIITRERARDVYDAYFLIKKNIRTTIDLIDNKLSYYKKEFDLDEFVHRLHKKRDLWRPELKSIIIGKFLEFEEVEKEVIEFLKRIS